jgi:rare lipoprotein A
LIQKIIFVIGAFLAPFLYADTIKLSGNASFYSDKLYGKITASGERYHPSHYTAAHRELSFNTLVKVTNLINNRSVIVRINDRLNSSDNIEIDVSKSAAIALDLVKKGTAPVNIEILGVSQEGINPPQSKVIELAKIESSSKTIPEKKPLPFSDATLSVPTNVNKVIQNNLTPIESFRFSDLTRKKVSPKGFGLQIGAFLNDENAFKYGEWAFKKGFTAVYIENSKLNGLNIFRVIVGDYKNENEADSGLGELAKAGFSSAVIYNFGEEQ